MLKENVVYVSTVVLWFA